MKRNDTVCALCRIKKFCNIANSRFRFSAWFNYTLNREQYQVYCQNNAAYIAEHKRLAFIGITIYPHRKRRKAKRLSPKAGQKPKKLCDFELYLQAGRHYFICPKTRFLKKVLQKCCKNDFAKSAKSAKAHKHGFFGTSKPSVTTPTRLNSNNT